MELEMKYIHNLTQEQKMILTQKMQQSIKILQMPVNELRDYIDNQFAENPVLDVEDNFLYSTENSNENLKEYDYKEMVKYLEFDNYGSQSYESYEDKVSPFNFISEKKSLKEYLHEQVSESNADKLIKKITDYLIESLDNRGYLEITIEEISEELNLGCELVEEGLNLLQNMEPYGIGARDINECLKLQLIHLNMKNEILFGIIDKYLGDIAENRYKNIAKEYDISEREAQRYSDIIKKLEPKPSRGFFTGEDVKFIMPDAEIKEIEGQFYVIMNDNLLPKLSINNLYNNILNNNEKSKEAKYVKEKLDNAMLLIKSIEDRQSTLTKVLECIVKRQKEFLKHGTSYIVPMSLKEIAEEIKVHESTISRAIKDKFVLTSYGTIKVRDLFITGIINNDLGEDVSIIKIKNRIKEIISSEDKSKPFSDQKISEILNKENVNISRRTVAKYREGIGIKSSSKRKRL